MLKALTLTRYHIYYTMTQSKFWAAVLMILSAGYINVKSVTQIVFQYETPVSFGIFALIFSGAFFGVVLPVALLFIFSEMPFKNSQQIFLLTRSGKKTWCISQILFIIFISLFVILIISLETFLLFGCQISFDNSSWGKVIMSVYNTSLGREFEVTFIGGAPYETILDLSPAQSVSYVLTTAFLLSVTMGLIVFTVNLATGSSLGIIVGGVLVALNLFTSYFQTSAFFRLSPVSWIKLNAVKLLPFKLYPALVLGIITVAAICAALIRCRKKSDII